MNFERIFITSDQHGTSQSMYYLDVKEHLTPNDLVISCGDFGVPYFSTSKMSKKDAATFELFNMFNTNFAIIQGNHSKRFENIKYFKKENFCESQSFYCSQYKNFHFLQNGNIYNINNIKFLVMGGGYSVDKYFRIMNDWQWEPDEKLNDYEKNKIRDVIKTKEIDFVLSHVAPLELQPTRLFLPMVNQSEVETDQEEFFSEIRKNMNYLGWFIGHYHDDCYLGEKEYMVFRKYLQVLPDKSILGLENLYKK